MLSNTFTLGTCPNCKQTLEISTSNSPEIIVYVCCHCGFISHTIRVRKCINFEKDLGIYRFATNLTIYGYITLIYNNDQKIEYCVDKEQIENFINDICNNFEIKSAIVSYFKDNEIHTEELLKYIR